MASDHPKRSRYAQEPNILGGIKYLETFQIVSEPAPPSTGFRAQSRLNKIKRLQIPIPGTRRMKRRDFRRRGWQKTEREKERKRGTA